MLNEKQNPGKKNNLEFEGLTAWKSLSNLTCFSAPEIKLDELKQKAKAVI